MEQSEPANLGNPWNGRAATSVQGSVAASELAGYTNIGMKEEALRILDATLKKKRITPDEFFQIIRTVGVHSDFKRWKTKIDAAYQRQPQKFKRQMRSEMLSMYASLKEWETARQFVSVQRPSAITDFLLGMDVLLELDRLEGAKILARRCKRVLSRTEDPFEKSMLLEALAKFSARMHNWGAAIEYWRAMPLDQPFRQNALTGIVQLHLACAYECVEIGLQKLADLKGNVDVETELCAQGSDLGLTTDAEKELLKFKCGIEKLLPEKVRRELHVMSAKELFSPDFCGDSDETVAER